MLSQKERSTSKPFLFFVWDHLGSKLGIIYGRGSFAIHFWEHLRFRDNLRYCTELLVTMLVVSLLVSLISVSLSFHGFIPKTVQYEISLLAACMAVFFLYVVSLRTEHQLLSSVFFSPRMVLKKGTYCGSPRGIMN